VFCTNCGNTVAEQAAACMSCGARPIGHKKFCRQCGIGFNPEQVVCIKSGVAVTGGAAAANIMSAFQTPSIPLDAKQRKARIHFWTVFCTITLVLLALAAIIHHGTESQSAELAAEIQKNSQERTPWGGVRGISDEQTKQVAEERIARIAFFLLVPTLIRKDVLEFIDIKSSVGK